MGNDKCERVAVKFTARALKNLGHPCEPPQVLGDVMRRQLTMVVNSVDNDVSDYAKPLE